MKSIVKVFSLSAFLAITLSGTAQTNSPASAPITTTDAKQLASLQKHIKPILDALNLQDTAKETTVSNVLSAFLTAHTAWHEANDATLKEDWNDFNHARSKQDKAGADKALAGIGGVYATFKPEHDKLISGLATVLSPEQIATVEDVLTVNKVKVTYNAYLEIFPTLTDGQKAVVLKDLESARDEAVDAGSMTEKSAFFKKYKIIIEEDYLARQGYDPKQARKDFAAKQKAAAAAQ
jgi:Protein of unknown function (DUF3826)